MLGGDYQSTVEYTGVDARVTIHVGSYFDDETGVFELAVTCYGAGDSNYSTTDSTTVSNINGPSNTVSSYTTSPSFNTDLVCGSSLQGAKTGHASVTYSYEPSRNEVVVFSLCSDYTDFDTTISIYDVEGLRVAYNDDDDACGYQSTVAYTGVDARVTIHVGSYFDDETGVFELAVTCYGAGDGNYSTTNGTRSSNKTGQSFVNESSYDEWSSTVQSYEHVSWYGSGSS